MAANNELGQRIQRRIEELGLSIRQAALEAGMSPGNLADICRGDKGIGKTTARKLAPVLGWPAQDLLDLDMPALDRRFWLNQFGMMLPNTLDELRKGPPGPRVTWSLVTAAAAFPDLDLAALIGISREQVERLKTGTDDVSGPLLDQVTRGLQLPPYWLFLGEIGPTEALANEVINHHNGAEWLEVVRFGITHDLAPYRIRRIMEALIDNPEHK